MAKDGNLSITAGSVVWPMLLLAAIAVGPIRGTAQDTQSTPDVLDMSLKDLMKIEIDSVFGVSGYKQNISSAPASITIVTADEINRYGYRTLADILRNVPGFYVTSDRVFSYVGVRGFGRPGDYNSRILLLVDGHRLSDGVSGGTSIGLDFPVDIDLIDRVEVIRGPNSPVYIASALLGVINVVTKRTRSLAGFTAAEEVANYGTYRSRLTYGRRFQSGAEILLSGSYGYRHGPRSLYFKEFDTALTNQGIAKDADGGRDLQQFARLSYRNFNLQAVYGPSKQGDPTASYGTIFNDRDACIRLTPAFVHLSYDHNLGSDWGYAGQIYYDDNRYHGTYPVDESSFGRPSRVLNQDQSRGRSVGFWFSLSKRISFGQTLIAGAESRNNFELNQWNYDSQPYALYFSSHLRSNVWGFHLQDTVPIRDSLTLDLGLNHDAYSTFGGTTNPRAALIYQPSDGTSLKILYGQSFRAPTAYELYYSMLTKEASPDLRPETARTMEVVAEQSLARGFRLVASGYRYQVRGLISAETDPASGVMIYRNSDKADLMGTEIAVKRQSRSQLEASLSVSLQNADRFNAGESLSNSPRVLGHAGLSVPIFNGRQFAGMTLQYVSKRRTLAGESVGGYLLPNFTFFSRKSPQGWDISAILGNPFDQSHSDPASVAHVQDTLSQDGRTFSVKVTRHF